MEKLLLTQPSAGYEENFFRIVADFRKHGEIEYPKYYKDGESFDDFLITIFNMKNGINMEPNRIQTRTFWLVNESNDILATLRYRKELTDMSLIDGGHIGYDVTPSFRGRGYASIIFEMVLELISFLPGGPKRLLLTCEDDNVASSKIIEKFHGELEDKQISPISGKLVRRYWIDVVGV